MKLTWIGHSCFKVEKDGHSIVIDPYADDSVPGFKPIREEADLVLTSHEHFDHNYRDSVKLLKRDGFPFTIETMDSYHDDVKGKKRGSNKMFLISDGRNRVAHLGDIGCRPENVQMEKLKDLDALMIPVGGFYTIDAKGAADLVQILHPRIVIPMHYRSDNFGFTELGTVDAFTKMAGDAKALKESSIETEKEYPAQVIILSPANLKR